MGNGITRSAYRKKDKWHYLDKLPPRLRQALCNAAYTWDPKWFYDHWNKGKSVDWCINEIKKADLEQSIKDVKWREGFKWKSTRSATAATKVRPLYT